MLRLFEKNLIEHEMLKKGEGVLIAVSGGADSMVLLNLFNRLKKKWQLHISVAHINHGLRGRHSDLDEKLVRDTCRKIDIPFFSAKWNAPKKGNIQDAARMFRYNFCKSVGEKICVSTLATAHHGDDQVETVLSKLIRGSGVKGLCGISFISQHDGMKIIRPLLNFRKKEIIAYAKRVGIPFRHDASNNKICYQRNKIRHIVLPLLEEINPCVKDALLDVTESIQANFSAIEAVAKTFAQEYFTWTNSKVIWNRGAYLRLPSAIRRQVLIEAFECLNNNRNDLNSDQIKRMESISIGLKSKGAYMLPQGSQFERLKELLCIRRIKA